LSVRGVFSSEQLKVQVIHPGRRKKSGKLSVAKQRAGKSCAGSYARDAVK